MATVLPVVALAIGAAASLIMIAMDMRRNTRSLIEWRERTANALEVIAAGESPDLHDNITGAATSAAEME